MGVLWSAVCRCGGGQRRLGRVNTADASVVLRSGGQGFRRGQSVTFQPDQAALCVQPRNDQWFHVKQGVWPAQGRSVRPVGVSAFHGHPAAVVAQQVPGQPREILQRRKRAGGDQIEVRVVQRLDARMPRTEVGQPEFARGLADERRLLAHRVDAGDVDLGRRYRPDDARQTAAAADIQDAGAAVDWPLLADRTVSPCGSSTCCSHIAAGSRMAVRL